tara:strand:+ start:631 stop:1173 length:543 start_codon:yes stop_codon:yes gene_type:complete
MSGWLYLIQNRDLYKIGITKNFENRMRQLKPDIIVAKIYTRDFVKLERELHIRYKKFRIPQTEYFRLEDKHLKEIKQRISKLDYTLITFLEIFIRSLSFLIVIFFLILLFLYLNINDINTIILKLLIWMERISIVCSIISLFLHSGKYLSFLSELKYKFSTFIIFNIFALVFSISSAFIQ